MSNKRKAVEPIGAKTISFVKGKGSLNHNNREFIHDNVDKERIAWNRIYKQESIKEAYDVCFGQALVEYNAKQKRKDRIKSDYMEEIKHSGNKEKVFYENVVQIGKMDDTSVVDENGELTESAKKAIEVLEIYAKTFQERNPNLYVFNSVMHLDEATPHLHIDYIPVAHGYKNGLQTRNSLTKAFQEMGFEKATGKRENETMAWQKRERAYLKELCEERGIEIEELGIARDNYTLPEYKQIMLETAKLQERINELKAQAKADKVTIDKYALEARTLRTIEKAIKENEKSIKGVAVPVRTFLKNDEYVKIKKSDWENIITAYTWAKSREKLLDNYEDKIAKQEEEIEELQVFKRKTERFLSEVGLSDEFYEFISPKSVKKELEKKRKELETEKEKLMYSKQQQKGKKIEQEI